MTKQKYIDEKMSDYKTSCCQAKTYAKGRATAFCVKCDADVMMEMVLLAELYGNEYDWELIKNK